MVKVAAPETRICPKCGAKFSGIFTCIINGFYHDIAFVHMESIRIPGIPYDFPIPRLCGPVVGRDAEVEIDLMDQVIRVTK